MKKQRTNKGFTLVELIVVVLIMGVLAVTLVPQAMKWVSKAQESADSRVKDNLKSVGQAAVAEFESKGSALSDAKYMITSSGVGVVGGSDPNMGMLNLLDEYLGGDYPEVQNETGKLFQIEISNTGAVKVITVNGTY